MEQAEATFGAGAVLQLVSLVMKSLFFSFTNQQKGVVQPPYSFPDYSFIVYLSKLTYLLHCSLL